MEDDTRFPGNKELNLFLPEQEESVVPGQYYIE
jgi:hypothetical protein